MRSEPRRGRGLSRKRTSELAGLVRHWEGSWGTKGHRRWRGTSGNGESVVFAGLCGEETFCRGTVPFAFSVFLEGVLDGDGFIHEELAVHGFDSGVRGFEVRI